LLSNEISCIYSDKGKVRRIHLVVLMPSLESVVKLSQALMRKRINLASDGRPITGLSAKNLSEIIFEIEPKTLIIPAHIWTPWFSLFGSESGYDTLKDCFEDLSDKIVAVETGLSSDPSMNWRIKELEDKSLVSFSDAHSLPNLGREATIFQGEMGYENLADDLKKQNIMETIEFFPEEGKYHWSGHRDHQIVYSPQEIKEKGEICPVCGRHLTIGVAQRVEKLATGSTEDLKLKTENGVIKSGTFPKRPGFRKLVGLEKIMAEALGVAPASQKVRAQYERLVVPLGGELKVLTKVELTEIKKLAGEKIAEGVSRVREGKLKINPGYDNTYGEIKIWNDEEDKPAKIEQGSLF
jgi:uncharacterized protein (TIGR00375 family)